MLDELGGGVEEQPARPPCSASTAQSSFLCLCLSPRPRRCYCNVKDFAPAPAVPTTVVGTRSGVSIAVAVALAVTVVTATTTVAEATLLAVQIAIYGGWDGLDLRAQLLLNAIQIKPVLIRDEVNS